ncbi:FAD binding domain-containing protein [Desulfobacula sp.]|uniref:FAD binding domain-containing protein n=1 Tax=Desulfobacula sp. TaxID=2593537 RepID=UPI00261FD4A4|nr:FAD binding domain-containing protein [Desulfobacula sp.]
MKLFKHFDAESIDHVLEMVTATNGKTALMAGGTDLMGVLKSELLAAYPEVVINLKTIAGLDTIKMVDQECRIGATTRLTDIAASEPIQTTFPALAAAAASVGSPELRNMGTIGGNLCQDTRCWYYRYPDKMGGRIPCYRKGKGPCHAIRGENRYHAILGGKKCYAVCPSDLAIALGALDARVKVVGPTAEQMMPILDFFNVLGTVLKPDELVTEIRIPLPSKTAVQIFLKNRVRDAVDFAVVSVAVMVDQEEGVCRDARIILGAVAPTPYRAFAAEAAINGKSLNETHVAAAAEAAVKDAKPLSQNAYKIDITKALIHRALLSS